MEALKIFTLLFVVAGSYLWMQSEDYHEKFDKPIEVRYNCDMLIGGWHPDVPTKVIEECRKLRTYR
jgi:hypothetical protein